MAPSNRTTLQLASTSLAGFLCLTGGWLTPALLAPPAAHAYISRVDIVLDVKSGELFETFLRRAETVARAAAQRSFDRDILISEVSVIVVGQKNGFSVQVLSLQASRTQWRGHPDPRRWITYYQNARVLLGFGNSPGKSATSAPVVQTQSNPKQTTADKSSAGATGNSPAVPPASPMFGPTSTDPSPGPTPVPMANPPVGTPIKPIPDLSPTTTPPPPQ